MSFYLLALLFTYVNSPFVDMREGPSNETKVISQAIYGEKIKILDEQQDWVSIQTPDNYKGWIQKSHLVFSEEPYLEYTGALKAIVNRCAAHVYHVKDTEYGPIKTLPYESSIEIIDQFGDPNGRWLEIKLVDGTHGFIQRGDIRIKPQPISRNEMIALSTLFLNLPYTWGGRTSFGYDCSGFVQMLYRQMGFHIPRDSKDQIVWDGFVEIPLEAIQPGDLIYFGSEPNKASHVGMYLGDGQFIHSTVADNKPYLQISTLNENTWNGSNPKYRYRNIRQLKGNIL